MINLKDIISFAAHPFDWFRFTVAGLRDFTFRGGLEITTPFPFPSGSDARTYPLRTVLQLDADVIVIIPEPFGTPADDPAWQEACSRAYEVHRKEVEKVLKQLEGIDLLAWMVGLLPGIFYLLSLWQWDALAFRGISLKLIPTIFLIPAAYLIRKYAVRGLMAIVSRLA